MRLLVTGGAGFTPTPVAIYNILLIIFYFYENISYRWCGVYRLKFYSLLAEKISG